MTINNPNIITITESEYLSKNRLITDANAFCLTFDESGGYITDLANNVQSRLHTEAIESTGGFYNKQRIFLDCNEYLIYDSIANYNYQVAGMQFDIVLWINNNEENLTILHKPEEYYIKINNGKPVIGLWNGSSYDEVISDYRLNIHQFYYLTFQTGSSQKIFVNGYQVGSANILAMPSSTNNNLIVGALDVDDYLDEPFSGGLSLVKIKSGMGIEDSANKIKHKIRSKIGGMKSPTTIKIDFDKKEYKYIYSKREASNGNRWELMLANRDNPKESKRKVFIGFDTIDKRAFSISNNNENNLTLITNPTGATTSFSFFEKQLNFYQPLTSANLLDSGIYGASWGDGSIDYNNGVRGIGNNTDGQAILIYTGVVGNYTSVTGAGSADVKIVNSGRNILYSKGTTVPELYLGDINLDDLTITGSTLLTGSVATGVVGFDFFASNYSNEKIYTRAGNAVRKGTIDYNTRSITSWEILGAYNIFYCMRDKYFHKEIITDISSGGNFLLGKFNLNSPSTTTLDDSAGLVYAPNSTRNNYNKTNISSYYKWDTLLNHNDDLTQELINNGGVYLENDGWVSTSGIIADDGTNFENDSYLDDYIDLNSTGTISFKSTNVVGGVNAKFSSLSIIKPNIDFYDNEQKIFAYATGTAANDSNVFWTTISNSGTVYANLTSASGNQMTCIWDLSNTNVDRYQNKWFGLGFNVDLENDLIELIVNNNKFSPNTISGDITTISGFASEGLATGNTNLVSYTYGDFTGSGLANAEYSLARFGFIANESVSSNKLIEEIDSILYFYNNGRNISDRYNWDISFNSSSFDINNGTVLTNKVNSSYNGSVVSGSSVWNNKRIDCTTTTGATITVGSGCIDSNLTDLNIACLIEISQSGSVSELFNLDGISVNLAQDNLSIAVDSDVTVTSSVNLNYQEEYKIAINIDFTNQTISIQLDESELALSVSSGSMSNLALYPISQDIKIGTTFKGYITRFNLGTNNNQYYD